MKPFENVDDQLNHFLNPQAMDPTHNLNFKERTRSSLEFILFLWNWRSIIQNQTSAAKAEGQIVLTFSFGRPLHSYFHATLFSHILVLLGTCTSSIVVDKLRIAANSNVNFNLQNAKHIWQYLTFEFAAIRNLSTTIEEVQVPKSTKIHGQPYGIISISWNKQLVFVKYKILFHDWQHILIEKSSRICRIRSKFSSKDSYSCPVTVLVSSK